MVKDNKSSSQTFGWQYTGEKRPKFAVIPEEGQESVWDYPRPPSLLPGNRRVQVMYEDCPLADSMQSYRVLETASPPTFYLPISDIDMAKLVQNQSTSFCEWKGHARYYDLHLNEQVIESVAWDYPEPMKAFHRIREHLCFYPSRVICHVNGERVRPQQSEFYGGWITSEVVGPFKGDRETRHW